MTAVTPPHSTTGRPLADWRALDAAHHWHPFTDSKALAAEGVRMIERADGVYLWDAEGNKILDGMAGLWCVNAGYGRRELIEAAHRQMEVLPYYNTFFKTSHAPATELAALLADIAPPGFSRAMFVGSGSEAIDTMVRMVRLYWQLRDQPQRRVLISRRNAYHGSTVVGLSLGGMGAMHKQHPVLPDFAHIEPPHQFQLGWGEDPDAFGRRAAGWLEDKILEIGPDKVAAFVGEPIQGAGGLIYPPDSYWPEIERICRKYGILLVADEVITGYGRTGAWFGCQSFGFSPDIMTTAKGLTSGYLPMGAVLVGDTVAETLINRGGEFFHGFTYAGHPVCAAVAIANITLLRREKIVEKVHEDIGPYLQSRLRELADHPLVGEVRGRGLIAGIELVKDKTAHAFFPDAGKVGTICRDHCFRNGLIMRAVYDTMVLAPPLVLSRAEADELVAKAQLCLDLTARDVL